MPSSGPLSSPPNVLNSHHPEMPTAPPRTHPRTRRAFTGLEAPVAVASSTLTRPPSLALGVPIRGRTFFALTDLLAGARSWH